MTTKIAVLMLSSLAFVTGCMIWPDMLTTIENELAVFAIEPDLKPCNFKDTYCGQRAIALSKTSSHPMAGGYTVSIVYIPLSSCPAKTDLVRFNVNDIEYRASQTHGTEVFLEPNTQLKIQISSCVGKGGYSYMNVPSIRTNMSDLNERMYVCKNGIHKYRPNEIIINGNETKIFVKGSECFEIETAVTEIKCRKTNRMQADTHVEGNRNWCSINRAQIVDKDAMKIYVSYRKGGKVCINGLIKNSVFQQCKIVKSSEVEFKLFPDVKQIEVKCDDERSTLHKKEENDLNCFMPFKNTEFSKHICQRTYRPIMFWISVLWLLIGLPICYMIVKFIFYVKCKLYIRSLKKDCCLCESCGQKTNGQIENLSHGDCHNGVCPYCRNRLGSLNDLKKHANACYEREDLYKTIEELANWECQEFTKKNDPLSNNSHKKWRCIWIGIFIVIFFSCFTPAVSHPSRSSCMQMKLDYTRECMLSNVNLDNSHVPSKHESESQPNLSMKDVLVKMTDTLLENIEASEVNIKRMMVSMEEMVKDELAKSNRVIFDAIKETFSGEGDCELKFKKFDMNLILPASQQSRHYSMIRVHNDDYGNLTGLVPGMRGLRGEPSIHEGKEPKVVIGQDAVVQQGGSYQYALGGSGSDKKLATGGSTMHGEPARTPASSSLMSDAYDEMINEFEVRRPAYRHGRHLLSIDDDIEMDGYELEMKKAVKEMHEDEESQRSEVGKPKKFDIRRGKNIKKRVKGVDHNVTIIEVSNPESPLKKNLLKPHKEVHSNWYDFHDTRDSVCEKTCLHEPGTCTCVHEEIPKGGKYQVPWATIVTNNIHKVINPSKFTLSTLQKVEEDDRQINTKTVITSSIDLKEGSFLNFKLSYSNEHISPILSIVIPKVTQIYSTRFLYYTCEREIETEVKGICTGWCGDYCLGDLCLGTRVWKWQNCRKVWCNPWTCATTNDGCCCCGANVYCKPNAKIASVWSVSYERTEYVICMILNDRLQNCKLMSETTEAEFGPFKLGTTKVLDPDSKLPKVIAIVHSPIKDKYTSRVSYENHDQVYLDPPVCKSSSSCNHGFIGDLQTNQFQCLRKMGKMCRDTEEKLHADNCTEHTTMIHSNTNMVMTCHTFHHHSCDHEHVVRKLSFDDHLSNSEKLSDKFIVNKLKIDFENKGLLIYPTPKSKAGTVLLTIEGDGIMIPKADKSPKVDNVQVMNCKGCYSCKLGFSCEMVIEVDEVIDTMVEIESRTASVEFSKSPITLVRGSNDITIWGLAYSKVNDVSFCIKFGTKCLKEIDVHLTLHEPTGNFVPVFGEIVAKTFDPEPICSGMNWFSCAAGSVSSFFTGIWQDIWNYLLYVTIILVGIVIIMNSPKLIYLLVKLCTFIKRKRLTSKIISGSKSVQELYRSVRNRPEYEMKKKDDDAEYSLKKLMLEDPASVYIG